MLTETMEEEVEVKKSQWEIDQEVEARQRAIQQPAMMRFVKKLLKEIGGGWKIEDNKNKLWTSKWSKTSSTTIRIQKEEIIGHITFEADSVFVPDTSGRVGISLYLNAPLSNRVSLEDVHKKMTVPLSKSVEQIARDIRNRIMKDFEIIYETALAKQKEYVADSTKLYSIVSDLNLASCGNLKDVSSNFESNNYGDKKHGKVDSERHDFGLEGVYNSDTWEVDVRAKINVHTLLRTSEPVVKMELENISPSVAKKILKLLYSKKG